MSADAVRKALTSNHKHELRLLLHGAKPSHGVATEGNLGGEPQNSLILSRRRSLGPRRTFRGVCGARG